MRKFWSTAITVVSLAVPAVPMAACGDDATGPVGTDTQLDTVFNPDGIEVDTGLADATDATNPEVTLPDATDTNDANGETGETGETVDTTPVETDSTTEETADTTPVETVDTTPNETVDTTPGETVVPEGTSAQIQALITAATGAAAPVTVAIQVDNATVTMTKPAIAVEQPGFFIQGDKTGPAIFVVYTGAEAIVRNDIVSFKATQVTLAAGVMFVSAITDLDVEAGGGDADLLIQDVSGVDLVTGYDALANEHVSFEAEITGEFAFAGEGYASAPITTDGVATSGEGLKIRLPATLVAGLALGSGCLVEVSRGVIWRFQSSTGTFTQTQPSVYEDFDIFAVCDGPKLASATASSATEVILAFDKAVDPASITNATTQFTVSGGLTVSAAAVVGNTIKLTTSDQTAGTSYVVTIAQTVTDVADRPVVASAQAATFTGFAGLVKLIINELDYDQPDAAGDVGEFVEIYNPNDGAIDLAGFKLQTINGEAAADPKVAVTYTLTGSIPGKGYAVIATTPVSIDGQATAMRFANAKDNIQNGARDGVRIITTAGSLVVDALLYETPANADAALLAFGEGTPFSGGENGDEPNKTLSRCPNATDTNNNATDFLLSATPTPGKANVCTTP